MARRGTEEAGDAPATKPAPEMKTKMATTRPKQPGQDRVIKRVPEDPLKVQEEGIDERRDLPERRTKGVVSAENAQTPIRTAPVEAIQNRVRRKLHRDKEFKPSQRDRRRSHRRWVGTEGPKAAEMATGFSSSRSRVSAG